MRRRRDERGIWNRLTRRHHAASRRDGDGEASLRLERERQELRLELDAERRSLEHARGELAAQREREQARVVEAGRAQAQRLLTVAASGVAQLSTQAHLMQVEGRDVLAGDVLAVALRLVRALEAEGLERVGGVGERVAFDPARHELLDAGGTLPAGETVVVRFVGIAHRGVTLRKVGVDSVEA